MKRDNVRWIKQQNSYSCVPVAFLNILKWSGADVTYRKDFKTWVDKTKCDKKEGSAQSDYFKLFKQIPGIKVKRRYYVTLKEIDDNIKDGKIVLLVSAWDDPTDGELSHVTVVVKRTDRSLFLTNTFRGHGWFRKEKVEEFYLERHEGYPTGWFIEKLKQIMKEEKMEID